MLEKRSEKTIVVMALASIMVLAFQLSQSTPAYSADNSGGAGYDDFGVKEIYPTTLSGNEWYVNMNDPTSDSMFRNLPSMTKQSDGSWQVSASQVRMEAWSPADKKWQNVEITEYAKIIGGSNELLQMYSRGGHHTDKDQCLGSAYKARLYGDGEAAWNKEITHPAYAGNRGETRATTEPLADRWVGFKAVIYNIVENGKTYVRLESYIDDDVTDGSGHLVVNNNWKLASVYEDKGGWATHDSDFNSSCGRDRDEILTGSGGTSSQNIAAFRSDSLTWDFKYLSVREIDPLSSSTTIQKPELPIINTPDFSFDNSEESNTCDTIDSCTLIAGQHVPNDGKAITTINSLDLQLRKKISLADGFLTVAIVKDGNIVGSSTINIDNTRTIFETAAVQFNPPVDVAGTSFDIYVLFNGKGVMAADSSDDYTSGNLFDDEGEVPTQDLVFEIH